MSLQISRKQYTIFHPPLFCQSLKEELRFLEDSVRDKPRPSLGRQEMDPDKMADRIKKLGVSLDLNNQRCQKYELQLKELKGKRHSVQALALTSRVLHSDRFA